MLPKHFVVSCNNLARHMERGGYPLYQLPGVLVFRQQTLDNIYYTTCILYTVALYTTVPINSTLLQYILYNVLQCPPDHYIVYNIDTPMYTIVLYCTMCTAEYIPRKLSTQYSGSQLVIPGSTNNVC